MDMKKAHATLIFSCNLIFSGLVAQPSLEWKKEYSSVFNVSEKAVAITSDNQCNVYITGPSYSTQSNNLDYYLLKINQFGDTLWTRRYNGTSNGNDIPVGILCDNSGNVFLTGESNGGSQGINWATLKYNSSGTLQATKIMNGPYNFDDRPAQIAYDNISNRVLVGGTSMHYVLNNQTNNDAVVFVYDNNLNDYCSQSYAGGFSFIDVGQAIQPKPNGSGYFWGCISGLTAPDRWAGGTVNYSTPNCISQTSNGPDWGNCNIKQIVAPNTNNVYYLGALQNYWLVEAYSQANFFMNSPLYQHFDNSAMGMAVSGVMDNNNSHLYVCGYKINSSGNTEILVRKLNATNLNQVWTSNLYSGPGNGDSKPVAVFIDNLPTPNIYVAGYHTNSAGKKEIILLKYSVSSGTPVVMAVVNNSTYDEICTGAVKDNGSNFYLTGYRDQLNAEKMILAKFCNNASVSSNIIVSQANILTTQTSNASSYQWYYNGTLIPGATNQSLNIASTGSGNYCVRIGFNNCCVDSVCTSAILGVNNINHLDFQMHAFINADGMLQMEVYSLIRKEAFIEIYNLPGEKVFYQTFLMNEGVNPKIIDLRSFNNNMYLLKLVDHDGSQKSKMIYIH